MAAADQNVDYYKVLGVKPDATEDAIRQAYIKESLKWHPDRNPSTESTAMFQQVAQAYFVLSDKDRRNAYDRARRDNKRFATDENVDPSSMFGSVFDELLTPEVPNPIWFWEPIGGAAGFVMGFIVFNIPGALFGAWTGKKMGKVRDMKGVAVYEAFSKLGKDRKAEILSQMAQKMFSKAL
ncbi:hypothetical protein PhCBS80983_g01277 [Powellomyces hirtus]|uniref:J domain-containing protein n=1 Tax=Powellomyces hirtus TaxID=109895 RepID=A0A507EBJ1_9FUNG|nr:DnaJ domain-containing protein [Powellomyces hirtus]TPX61184.1 hypothetical protein PhCBS80983_g01277 [Powellomyces hirtus]